MFNRKKRMNMKTMMIAVGGVYADYQMIGKEIEIVRVYRNDHTFTDSIMIDHAKFTIKAVNDGWMTIGKGNSPSKRG
jgi:hypothetical protein